MEALKDSHYNITVVMDTKWRQRYRRRSLHPEQDAEKMVAKGDLITGMSRVIPPEAASREFTGVLRMTAGGAAQFLESYGHHFAEFAFNGRNLASQAGFEPATRCLEGISADTN